MNIDRLLLAMLPQKDADTATNALTQAGLAVTRISSVGGYLGKRNVTLLIGLAAEDVDRALYLLRPYGQHQSRAVDLPKPEQAPPQPASMNATLDLGGVTTFEAPVARYVHCQANHSVVDEKYGLIEPGTMQLVLVIVPDKQAGELVERLTAWSYHVTLVSTTGGFWRRGNATLFIAARSERVDSIVSLIFQMSESADGNNSCATIFVLDLAQSQRLMGFDFQNR